MWPDVASEVRGSRGPAPTVAHYTEKQRLTPRTAGLQFRGRAQRLARVYVLGGGRRARTTARIGPVSLRDAVIELARYTFCLETRNRERLAYQFDRLSHDARVVPMRRLAVPRTLALLDRVREAILADLSADGE